MSQFLGVFFADVNRLIPVLRPGNHERASELAAELVVGRQALRRFSRQKAPLGTVCAMVFRQGVMAAPLKRTQRIVFLGFSATVRRGHRSGSRGFELR